MKTRLATILVCAGIMSCAVEAAQARVLTFKERVEAQRAIEQVYYAHQIEARKPFEEAVPQETLEKKVHAYLRQSAALERFWNTPVTAEMLQAELKRIVGSTRFPDRLQEIFAALGNDSFLVQECFARPVLVDRLSRSFFAGDDRIHGDTQAVWESWWESNGERFDAVDVKAVATLPDSLANTSGIAASPTTSCIPADSWDNGILQGIPRPADHHSAIWTGSLMIVWGGNPLDLPYQGARYDPLTDTWTPVSTLNAPSPRQFHTSVWTGSRMIVWGGQLPPFVSNPDLNSGGQYDPIGDSWTPTSLLNAPTARRGHVAIWTGSLMLIVGGSSGSGARYDPASDTWLPSPGFTGQNFLGMSVVWTGSYVIYWGGWDGASSYVNFGSRYDPTTDIRTNLSSTNAPAARAFHTAVWTGTRMVIWGGTSSAFGGPGTNTGGVYDPGSDSWTPTSAVNAPITRSSHSAVWTGTRMIVWGGYRGGFDYTNQGGQYDPAADSWTPTSTLNAPEGRSEQSAIWTGDRMIVWGGRGQSAISLDTGGRYDPASDSWTPTSTTGQPSIRTGQTTVWTGNLMVVWGGGGSSGAPVNTGGRYDPLVDAWTPTSLGPQARTWHVSVWTGDRMVVWGDQMGGFPLPGGRYDPVSDSWTPVSITNAPLNLSATAVWTGSRMIVWGKTSSGAQGGQYDPLADVWTPTSAVNAPAGRSGQTAVWTGIRMIIWGGSTTGGFQNNQNTGGQYDPVTDTWTSTSLIGAPSPRIDHQTVWTGDRMVVWGGTDSSNIDLDTGGQYDPIADAWTPTSTQGAASPRRSFPSVWTGTRMIVWGGLHQVPLGNNVLLDTGGLYDPALDSWAATSVAGAPSPRSGHQAVWTGSLMIVWGGRLGSGGRYAPEFVGSDADEDGDGFSLCDGDCDDANPDIHPGAVEICNGVDDNCVAGVDEGDGALCADAIQCTADVCAGAAGCTHPNAPDGTTCDDGDSCTQADACLAGTCGGSPIPPTISVSLSPSVLQPANHKLVNIVATVQASAACGSAVTVVLSSLTSSEPDDAPGPSDGSTTNDIQGATLGTADFSFKLRAEADKNGTGRTYTASYLATDGFGNQTVGHATAFVRSGGQKKPILSGTGGGLEKNLRN